jgi:hypothetical protein
MNHLICILLLSIGLLSCNEKGSNSFQTVQKRTAPLGIDGFDEEPDWLTAEWRPIDQLWLGTVKDTNDFQGRYKMIWDEGALFVFAEIKDDILLDIHSDPLERYWDDDCLEIFVDEDHSGGNHQYNHNAFAYHIALDGNVVDIGTDSLPHIYNEHIIHKIRQEGKMSYYECMIKLFSDNYRDDTENKAIKLSRNKALGFAIAYCDNDSSSEREAFIGSVPIEGEDKNRGWIDAGIFDSYILE